MTARELIRSFAAAAAPVALLWASAGCSVPDLTRPSEVVRLRVLGVQADPPEIALGETATFRYVVGNPEGADVENLWLLCTEIDTGFGVTSCGSPVISFQDPTADTYEFTADPDLVIDEEIDEQGQTVPVTLAERLASLEPLRRVEGIGFKVYLVILPAEDFQGFLDLMVDLGSPDADPDALQEALADLFGVVAERGELATKRVAVADKGAASPEATAGCEDVPGLVGNANPDLLGLVQVDATTLAPLQDIPEGATLEVPAGATIALEPSYTGDSVERYYYIRLEDEVTECRTEEPLFGWYATGGTFSKDYSYLDDDGTPGEVSWTAPDEVPDEPIDAWLVTWDRRGGLDWVEFRFQVSQGATD